MSDQLSILSEARTWPEKVVADWRRFSSGLWRVSEGDIQAAYSVESFPKVKVFTHNGVILTNGGGFFSGPVAAAANCYPLIPADEYRGPEPCRYTCEGREACYRGEVFKLGPKIVFVAIDATIDEWRGLLRSMYADGGWFARHADYGLFLNEDRSNSMTGNAREALRLELVGGLLDHSKADMKQILDGMILPPKNLQLDFSL